MAQHVTYGQQFLNRKQPQSFTTGQQGSSVWGNVDRYREWIWRYLSRLSHTTIGKLL